MLDQTPASAMSGSYEPPDLHFFRIPFYMAPTSVRNPERMVQEGAHHSEMISEGRHPDRSNLAPFEEACAPGSPLLECGTRTLTGQVRVGDEPETGIKIIRSILTGQEEKSTSV